MTDPDRPGPSFGGEDDPGADTETFRAFVAGDRVGRLAGDRHDGGRLEPSPSSTSGTRFRAMSLLVGLVVFALLVWLLLQV